MENYEIITFFTGKGSSRRYLTPQYWLVISIFLGILIWFVLIQLPMIWPGYTTEEKFSLLAGILFILGVLIKIILEQQAAIKLPGKFNIRKFELSFKIASPLVLTYKGVSLKDSLAIFSVSDGEKPGLFLVLNDRSTLFVLFANRSEEEKVLNPLAKMLNFDPWKKVFPLPDLKLTITYYIKTYLDFFYGLISKGTPLSYTYNVKNAWVKSSFDFNELKNPIPFGINSQTHLTFPWRSFSATSQLRAN